MTQTLDHVAPSISSAPTDTAIKFHLSLNVANLDAAVGFYRILMGVAPAKCHPDYAKFEMSDPPVVLSLEPQQHASGGALNHLGFRVPTSAALVEMQHRLEAAGIATNREDGVECCYARQTKFWVKDPDQNLWEVYVLEADTDHRGQGSAVAPVGRGHSHDVEAKSPAPTASDVAWEHHLGQPFPASIPMTDASADRVYLRGTHNDVLTAQESARILQEVRRVLRPGGRVLIHGLAADAVLTDAAPKLPGPAAGVRQVPAQCDLADALLAANFSAIRLAKLSAAPVFRHEGIGLREILIEGIKLDSTPFDLRQIVQYQGPFREVTDDFGNVFPRGERKSIPTPAIEALRSGPIADSFLFFPARRRIVTAVDVLECATPKTRTTFYYGWVIVAMAAVAMVATLPGRTFGLGLITEPLLHDLHIDHVAYGTMNLWATLIGSAFCIGCGTLIDRLGSRLMLTATFALLGGTVLAMSRVSGSTGLLLTLIFTRGFGQSVLSVVSLTLVGKWFSRRLSIAMGVYSLLMGLGFSAAFIGMGHLLAVHDWRQVWHWMGWVLLGGLAPLAWLVVRRSPEAIGLSVDGLDGYVPVAADDDAETGLTLAEALASPAFWAYALSASAYGLIASGLMLFNQLVLHEHGFDGTIVQLVLALSTLTGLVGNLGGGWLAQRWSIGKLLAGAMFLLALALFALPLAHSRMVVYLYAITLGLAGGMITVGFFVCWGKVFGRLHLGAIQGAAQGLTVLASAAGPWLLAECVNLKHSSTPLLFSLAPVVSLLGIFCAVAPVPKIGATKAPKRGFEVMASQASS